MGRSGFAGRCSASSLSPGLGLNRFRGGGITSLGRVAVGLEQVSGRLPRAGGSRAATRFHAYHGTIWFFLHYGEVLVLNPLVTTTSTATLVDTPKEFVAIADTALWRGTRAATALHGNAFEDTAREFFAQCFGCGTRGDGEVDDADGNYYYFACWLVHHAAQAQLERTRARVQPGSHVQGVSCAPERAQHEQNVQGVSFELERQPQLPRPSAHIGRCNVQNVSFAFGQHAQRARTPVDTQTAHVHGSDADSDSDPELPSVSLHADPKISSVSLHALSLGSSRACWEKYDEECEAAAIERERAEARDERAREDLRADLFDIKRERWEDERYHEQRAEGLSHAQTDAELTQHDLEDLYREVAQFERHHEDGSSYAGRGAADGGVRQRR